MLLMVTEVMSVSDPPLSYTNENENVALFIYFFIFFVHNEFVSFP